MKFVICLNTSLNIKKIIPPILRKGSAMTKVCPTKIRIHVMESEEEEKNFFKKIRMGIGIDDDSPQ